MSGEYAPPLALPPHQSVISAQHVVLGAMASRDWQPQHHDHLYATAARLPAIIMNTPTQMGWCMAYLNNNLGPEVRMARWRLKMLSPLCPGMRISMSGALKRSVPAEGMDLLWNEYVLTIACADRTMSSAQVLFALPGPGGMRPWSVPDDLWSSPELSTGEPDLERGPRVAARAEPTERRDP